MTDGNHEVNRRRALAAFRGMQERLALLEELVLLTAKAGDWAYDRPPTNDELTKAIGNIKALIERQALEGKTK